MLLIIIVIGIFEINIIPFISPSIKWLNIVFHSIFGQFLIIYRINLHFSVQFSRSIVSNSLWPHEPQHARLPCPTLSPRVCSNLCPLNRSCYVTISSSVVPFSSCLQSFPSGSFPMSQFFTSGGQSTEFQLQHQSFQWIFRTDFL